MPRFKKDEVVILNPVPDGRFKSIKGTPARKHSPRSFQHGVSGILKCRSLYDNFWWVATSEEQLNRCGLRVHESQLLKVEQ